VNPQTKEQRADYNLIEESVVENERSVNFRRVFPTDLYSTVYKNFFEEERYNDVLLHNYIFAHKYKHTPLVMTEDVLKVSCFSRGRQTPDISPIVRRHKATSVHANNRLTAHSYPLSPHLSLPVCNKLLSKVSVLDELEKQ